jgi:NAD(P)-dependent dehydrogenase (short-subunit alcohol dehydrogenase family)
MSSAARPLQDRVLVVTGASAGIGAALARLASSRGARMVLAARREPELHEVARSLAGECLVEVADVTRRAEVDRLLARAIERFGHVDAWVNNAGRGISRPVAVLTEDEFDEMMRVNVKSALFGMWAVLPHFQARGEGHIVNVSSMLGRVPYASVRSAYCAAKHALNALTACLRVDLARTHPRIHVSTVSPGVVATDFGLRALGGGVDSRRLPGAQSADEVAAVIVDVLEHPQADVYTAPGRREMVVAYFAAEDMASVEAKWPAPPPPPAS